MKVLVTGGGGFVGSHAVAALLEAGHTPRLLARRPDRLVGALRALGVEGELDVVQGDVTDPDAVEGALDGCGGALHAANVYSLDPRREAEMHRINTVGTRLVLSRARAAGCDPIVHVSSVVTLFPSKGTIPADPPMGDGAATPYIHSKRLAERLARELQEDGAPVVTTYPGSVWGPGDPGPGEMVHIMRQWLGNRWPFLLLGAGMIFADVRWVAKVHAALFEPRKGPRRVNIGGHWVPWREACERLRRLTGRRLPTLIPTPRFAALATGWLADRLQAAVPVRLPVSYENSWFIANCAPTDDSQAQRLAGPPPPLEETLRAAILWAVRAGHVPASYAGTLTTGA